MEKKNSVFIASSLDGFIAGKNGEIDWLHATPNPENNDMGYGAFISRIDALVMGRTTFETIFGFEGDWPYKKPVFVLSNTLSEIPITHKDVAFLVKGSLTEVLDQIHALGYYKLYVDGGRTIQGFLKEDLIDEMIITTIPILLGGGSPLFSDLTEPLEFECIGSQRCLGRVVQNQFVRSRKK